MNMFHHVSKRKIDKYIGIDMMEELIRFGQKKS